MKVGIIRCQQTEDACPGTADFAAAKEGRGGFEGLGGVEIVGFVSCGGCPGKRAPARAAAMVQRGAGVILLGSCIAKGTPNSFPCPHADALRSAVERAVEGKAVVKGWTH